MTTCYSCGSQAGLFKIILSNGRWVVMHENENLGSYSDPIMALDDLVGGHTDFPSSGIDPSTLGLPDELGAWNQS